MTTQYTATQQLLPSNARADALSPSKVDVNIKNVDSNAFSSELNKASKNYTDKSEVRSDVKDTVDYKNATKTVDDSKKIVVKDNQSAQKQTGEITADEGIIADSQSECINVDEINAVESEQVSKEHVTGEIQAEEVKKTVEELIEEIKVNATTAIEKNLEIAQIVLESDANVQTTNKIATESMIANVEFDVLGLDANKLSDKINVVSDNLISMNKANINAGIQDISNNYQQTTLLSGSQVTNNPEQILNVVQDSVDENIVLQNTKSNLIQEVALNTELDVNSVKQSLTNEIVKDSISSDITRLTINLEDGVQKNVNAVEDIKNINTINPTDVTENVAPKIQVTEEIAAQVKDSLGTGIENKDTVSKIKDKAVETMTALQDKNSVLTESQTNDTNNNSTNLGQNNANETVAKLSVETNNFNLSQSQTAESFVNRLQSQVATRDANITQNQTINQSDILLQVNSKFEQLQQQSNNKVSIVLQPESLGRVSVEIMNTKDGIIAKMTTDTQQVKELFDKNIESLKSSLSAQGVNVNNIKVECTHESTNNAMNFEREQFNQSFSNQQNGHNANKSEQNVANSYGSELGLPTEETFDEQDSSVLKNTETIIKHNGKVDYSV